MPVVPFIPMIAQGVGMVAGGIASKKAQKNAMQRSPEEMQALGGAQGLAGYSGGMGRNLMGQGARSMAGPANYFQTLLQGNRAAMNQATAGPTAQLTDQYRGAERQLEGAGVRGAARDVAMSNLGRDRASKIAGLTTGMQPYAAEQLGTLGQAQLQGGQNAVNTAGTIYQNLLGKGTENRVYAREQGRQAGETWGKFVGDITKAAGGAFGAKNTGGGGIYSGPGSSQTTPNNPSQLPSQNWPW